VDKIPEMAAIGTGSHTVQAGEHVARMAGPDHRGQMSVTGIPIESVSSRLTDNDQGRNRSRDDENEASR